jgi:proline dehydrogenase
LGVELSENEARELFERFDTDKNGIIDIIEWTEYLKVEDLQTRPFFVKTKSTEQKGILPCLDADQLRQFENLMSRIDKLADVAQKSKVRLMIDAEQTYFQPGIDHVVMNLQRKYNKNFPVIFSTYQAYLKDAHHRLSIDLQRARNENFKFAAKIVRGAYMVAERRRAKELGIADPIHENIQATHACYHSCLDLMFKNIDMCEVMIASHNQNSIEYATHKMKELNIPAKDGGVYFGQLLGMSDHVSLTLGQNGYNAFKYVPFGPIDQVVPYLIRRLEENSAILKGVGVDKERKMLRQEFFRRLFSFGK